MNRVARAQTLWLGRRLALLGGSAAATAVAFGVQVVRLRLEPQGAALHGVALLVTLIVLAILLRLIRMQVAGPGLEAPSWERHAHRASVREAPLVALAGIAVVAFLVVATPRLVAEDRPSLRSAISVTVPEPVQEIAATTRLSTPAAAPAERVRKALDVLESDAESPLLRPIEINYRLLDEGQDEGFQESLQEPVDPTRPSRDPMLRLQSDQPVLPPVHFTVGAVLATVTGSLDLNGDAGRFAVDLDRVRGEQTFEMGVDVTAEFPLTAESGLKLMYAGLGIFESGHLTQNTSFGTVTGNAGDRYEFEMQWSHLYVALAKRVTGTTRGSWFDLSVHAGAMVDHTLSEFESSSSGVNAESEEGQRGWFSPGVGFSMSFRAPGSAGVVLEVVQSLPVNLGGQAIALTDMRAGFTADIVDGFSLFIGYRYVRSVYRIFDAPIVRENGETTAEISTRGPVFGLDFHF